MNRKLIGLLSFLTAVIFGRLFPGGTCAHGW